MSSPDIVIRRATLNQPRRFEDIACLVCGRTLKIEDADRPLTRLEDGCLSAQMVMNGVVCQALGNYGSEAFDPMGRMPTKGFAICDSCFRERADRMLDVVVGGALESAPEEGD